MKNKNIFDRLENHFNFRNMVTPLLIRLTYGAGVLCILGVGIGMLFKAALQPQDAGLTAALTIGFTLLALLLWRLLSEVGILAFNLHARLLEIRNLLALRSQQTALRQNASGSSALDN